MILLFFLLFFKYQKYNKLVQTLLLKKAQKKIWREYTISRSKKKREK